LLHQIGAKVEVIGARAFQNSRFSSVLFESREISSVLKLREIGSEAFANCLFSLATFTVPESVEILGDRCFADCSEMETIEFDGSSRLIRIGQLTFTGCKLHSITIPALTEEIDGSAFVNCPVIAIRVAPGSLNFKIEGNLLGTSDGREL
jgi:hypothetical protein